MVIVAMILHYFALVMKASKPRKTLFNKEWMEEKFGNDHSQGLNGAKIGEGGYPDHGSGRYTIALGYKGWMEFNKAQRIHYNYLESISQILCMMFICGLEFPLVTAIIGGVYLLSRIWFQVGYIIAPKARMYAMPFVMLTQFALPLFSIYSLSVLYSNRCNNWTELVAKVNEIANEA